MKWFGKDWGSPLCETCDQVPVPVGAICIHCEETIEEGDTGIIYANGPVAHRNCFFRQIFGSIAHQQKECGCYVEGSTKGDPPGMTKRQAADAAVKHKLGEDA